MLLGLEIPAPVQLENLAPGLENLARSAKT